MKLRHRVAVVTDFDGTVTSFDVGDNLALNFGLATAREVRASYNEGASVSQWMKKVFARKGVPSPSSVAAFVRRSTRRREGFSELVRHCSSNGMPLEIASGGLDVYICPLLSKWRHEQQVELRCGRARWLGAGYALRYPFPESGSLDSYKKGRVLHYQKRGYKVIFCGDGTSDYAAAKAADWVFARYKLLHYCRKHGVRAKELRTFHPVLRLLRLLVKADA